MTKQDAVHTALDDKIATVFGEVAFPKGLGGKVGLRDGRNVPTFVEEWLIGRYTPDGHISDETRTKVFAFVRDHFPGKGEKESLKHRLLNGEGLTILDTYSAAVDLKNGERRVRVRCIDVDDALVDEGVVNEYPQLFTGGLWGAGKLMLDTSVKPHRVRLVDFKPMQAGRVDLASFKDRRAQFTLAEWRKLLLRSMGYEPEAYTLAEQRTMITRLVPFVQPRINLMELAPKGTGKSFVYTNLSRYCWVVSGGSITAAALFYNNSTRTPGLLTQYDVVVLDEGQSIQFSNPHEMAGMLKGYLEAGEYTRGNNKATADAGLVILANILTEDDRPVSPDYVRALPKVFHESAVLDRFHGIVPGWLIPRFSVEATAKGMGLKADYLGEVFRKLRADVEHMTYVRSHTENSGDRRDITAIERLTAAFLKLYFPDLNVTPEEFITECLEPAIDLRERLRKQMARVDPGSFDGRQIAQVQYRAIVAGDSTA